MNVKQSKLKFYLLLLLIIFAGSLAKSQTGPASFLPEASELPGWRPAGEPVIYKNTNLVSLAGEETPVIKEFGFNYAVAQQYYNFGYRVIDVKVFVMENTFGSYGLFLRHSRKEKVFSDYGNSSFQKHGEYGFWKQKYFVSMHCDIENDTVNEGYRQIAAFIDSKIKSKGLFPGIMGLTGEDTKNVRLFSGPLGLSEVYYFSPLNIFFIQEGVAFERGDTTRIILKYPDNNEAVRRYSEAAGILGAMPKFTGFTMDGNFSFLMKDKEGKTLSFRVNESNLEISILKQNK
jgi:hypothetical protein